jgi:hypothetical protein
VESGRGFKGKIGSTEHALQAAHEVVMGEQPECAGFGKAKAELISEHRIRLTNHDLPLIVLRPSRFGKRSERIAPLSSRMLWYEIRRTITWQ